MSVQIDPDHQNTHAARHEWAVRFIDATHAQHLDEAQLIARCASDVMCHFDCSTHTALNTALHALATVQAREAPAYADINHSTSHVVYVVNPRTGATVAFTASELLKLAEENRVVARFEKHAVTACGRRADL